MRTIAAISMMITMVLVGVWAISEQAQRFNPDGNTSSSANETYNLSVDVFGGFLNTAGSGMIWFGVAAIVLVACGLLLAASQGGR